MKQSLIMAAFAAAAATACATNPSMTPEEARLDRIQRACALDAVIRPTITQLLTLPKATDNDRETVAIARAAIDPICANPAGSVGTNVLTTLTANTGKILAIVAKLQSE